jgi:hypothetical protein
MQDPNETWGNWFKRMLLFKEAPMIERSKVNQSRKVIPKV